MELSRTSRELTTNLRGHDYFVAHLGEVGWFRNRFGFRNRSTYPSFDGCAAIVLLLIIHERVVSEEFIEVVCLAGVVRMEKRGDGRRQLCIHGVRLIALFVRLSEWFRRR